MIYALLALFLAANVAALVSIAAWYHRDRESLVADRDGWVGFALRIDRANNELEEERDGLALLCDQERERAQVAETQLYGLFRDHLDVTPIEAARAARRA